MTTWRALVDEKLNRLMDGQEVINKAVIIGNGKPSLLNRTERLENWVGNVNRIALIVATAVIGQAVIMSCGMLGGLLFLLYQAGLLKGGTP